LASKVDTSILLAGVLNGDQIDALVLLGVRVC
jgi:hypothetical protein